MRLLLLLISVLTLTSCCKSDRIDHTDCNYIYVWKYQINGDSILYKYNQPRTVERKVMGGRMKHKKIKVDINNDDCYHSVRVPHGMNRSNIVRQAQNAAWNNRPLIGIFREKFYPYYEIEFIKYK